MPALPDEAAQLVAKGGQVGDLALDLGQVPTRDPVHLLAWPVALVGQPQQLAHGIQREAEIARAADEAQARGELRAGSRRLAPMAAE